MTTPEWHHIVLVLLAYLIGGVSPGYWLARTRGVDIRNTGSYSTGASNAARVLGRRGFYVVTALDVIKGMLVSCFAQYEMNDITVTWQFAAALAVVIGHIWPVWLSFRGGKGVAPFYGAWTPLGHWVGLLPALVCFILCLILKPLLFRSFKIAWLASLVIFPVATWWCWRFLMHDVSPLPPTIMSAVMVVLIWLAHRRNIAAVIHGRPASMPIPK